MPVKKRPPSLGEVVTPSTTGGVSVTDTLTLVVKDETGRVMRVKDNLEQPADSKKGSVTTSNDESRSILDRIDFEQLRMGPIVGQGAGGKVRVAKHKETHMMYAVKYVDFEGKSEDARNLIANELRRVEALKHECIVSSHEAYFRKSRLCVVLEWMDAGSIADVISRHRDFPEPYVAYVAKGLFKGLAHLCAQNIMHRDIKPANVLANAKGEVKISDFGIAKVLSGPAAKTVSVAGSTPYMSPEMLTNEAYSLQTDIWSAGMTIAECAIGAYPFVKKKGDPFEMFENVQKGSAAIVWGQNGRSHSELIKSFVNACLAPVASRPSAEEMLNHEFIKLADNITPTKAGLWFMEGVGSPAATETSSVV